MNKMEMECTSDDRSLSFSTSPEDFDMGFMKKPKVIRDPLSHRIIEKRRRDRMNNCLADLSHLIPSNYLKQGQGRIEKTEIIEMAIKLIKSLTSIVSKHGGLKSKLPDRYLGFKECQDEVMRYLVEVEEWDASDKLCHRMMAHLEQQGEKFRIMNDESLSQTAREEQYRHADEDMGVAAETMGNMEQNAKVQQYAKPPPINSLFCNPNNINSSYMESEIIFDGNNYENAEQVTSKQAQDKQLWTMLSDKANTLSENVEDSGISVGTPSNDTENTRRMYHLDTATMARGQKSGDIRTDACLSSGDSENNSANGSSYKFKHNITKRFSQQGSEMTSSCSGSMDLPRRKIRLDDYKCSRSPYSSLSSRHSKSEISSIPVSETTDSNKDNKDMKSLLPAFMLHPKGTHYIPLSIHPHNINSTFFTKKTEPSVGPCVYHPISIPVNFGGPVLYMKKISSNPSSKCPSTSPSNSIGSSGSPKSFDILEMSSGSSVDKSPSPPTLDNKDIKI